jgi:hypothetical protein
MAEEGDVYTPLNRRHGRIQPHVVGMGHLALGSETVAGGELDLAVLLSEVSATRSRARVILGPGPAAGDFKIVQVAAGSKDVSFLPAGGSRLAMRAGDTWFGVWNGEAWLTVFCSARPPDEPVPEPAEREPAVAG